MRYSHFIAPLVLLPLYTFSPSILATESYFLQVTNSENTLTKVYSNASEEEYSIQAGSRTINYPTQIIRTSSKITDQELGCDEVINDIEKNILGGITANKFLFHTLIGCSYDPDTLYAKSFFINSYFDPVSDEAIDYLKSYLAQYNGADVFGTKLSIESAKGLIVSLNIAAGVKKNPKKPPFIEYKQDRNNLYFDNNFAMENKLFTDIKQNFFSNDPNKIFPFLDKWIFAHASVVYLAVLRDANYVELQPELIFLMEDGEKIFVSQLKYHFGHSCAGYENHRCLKTGM